MEEDDRIEAAERLMDQFALRTGIGGIGDPARRYLWTDAYAVLALLGLYRRTREHRHLQRAIACAELVHWHLGRHRPDDARSGWISGLGETEGLRRPTAGGLRIGKPLPERTPLEPPDGDVEWNRDGQYFHYLTRWMQALNRLSAASGDPQWNSMAVDLGLASHAGFTYEPRSGEARLMRWKMSIDLSRPLVRGMGLHDPLDGFVTFAAVRALERCSEPAFGALDVPIADFFRMCEGTPTWSTTDPLGIGGLLCEAGRLEELIAAGEVPPVRLLSRMVRDAADGLRGFMDSGVIEQPPAMRLAFRELGLTIGLQCAQHFDAMSRFLPLVESIEAEWRSMRAQASIGWVAHQDINAVMLAASLVPDAISATWEPAARPEPLAG